MRWNPILLAAASITGTIALGATSAEAAGILALPAAVPGFVAGQQQSCDGTVYPALGKPSVETAMPVVSKSAAILGGAPSKLDLIAASQTQPAAPVQNAAIAPALAPSLGRTLGMATQSQNSMPGRGVVPGANGLGGGLGGGLNCAALASAAMASKSFAPGLRREAPGTGDFLASHRLAVARTAFDSSWNRVRASHLPAGVVQPMAGLSGNARLAAVNAWANHRIRYVEDRDQYGRADFWAPAAATLMARAGDCEDIAIVKMQMLAALGVDRADMFLTVARDRVRNQDHALLIVKSEGRFWLLDNATDTLLDASDSNDYLPILTFSESSKWLHGF